MANKRISDLTSITTPGANSLIEIEDPDVTAPKSRKLLLSLLSGHNPTTGYLPYWDGSAFADSPLRLDGDYLLLESDADTGFSLLNFENLSEAGVGTSSIGHSPVGLYLSTSETQIEFHFADGRTLTFAKAEFPDRVEIFPGSDDEFYLGNSTRRFKDFFIAGKIIHDATNNVFIAFGAGDPEGALVAGVGSLFLRTDGGAGTVLNVKESGTGNTGWTAG